MPRVYSNPQDKLERISEIFNKMDIFYHLKERNDQGYVDLPDGEGSELIDELETLVNS